MTDGDGSVTVNLERLRTEARARLRERREAAAAYRENQERECRRINAEGAMMREMGFGPGWRPLDPDDPYSPYGR